MKKLKISQIDFRVGMVGSNANGAFATILAYKDARVDMTVLDEKFGVCGWQNEYKRDTKGVLQCGIGVFHKETNQWIWKWSNGTESNTEKQKGEYSDAFKRAGFMWGIGRELYDYPFLYCKLLNGEFRMEGNKAKATGKLKPNDWHWEILDGYIKATDKNNMVRVKAKLS